MVLCISPQPMKIFLLLTIVLVTSICQVGLPWQFSWQIIRLQSRRPWFNPWVRMFPCRRDSLPSPVFLGFPCGSESTLSEGDLGGYSPWGCKQLDTTERLSTYLKHNLTNIAHHPQPQDVLSHIRMIFPFFSCP